MADILIMGMLATLRSANIKRPYDAILWWEIRRFVFNAVVALGGACSFVVLELIGARYVQPGEDVIEPLAVWFGAALVMIAANACYTLGWVTELMWSEGDTSRTEATRPRVYRRGMMFSAAVALTPGAVIVAGWLIFGSR